MLRLMTALRQKALTFILNNRKLDVSALTSGKTYAADISEIAMNGLNSLQVSGLTESTVRVCIPYPEVIEGSIKDAGISEESIKLIDMIINADIEQGFTSAQLAIIKDGKLVYQNAWGNVKTYNEQGEPANSNPVTNDTLYDLASNTKMYSVNYALQYLVTQGEIDINAKVADILGAGFYEDVIQIDYENYDAVSLETNKEWKANLTLRDLLCHQGGFPPGPQYF